MPSIRKKHTDSEIPRELRNLMNFFPLPNTSSPPRRFTRTFMNNKVETRIGFRKSSTPPVPRKISSEPSLRRKYVAKKMSKSAKRTARAQSPLQNILNESFAQYLATELGRLSPSRQLKARAKLENVISQITQNGH